MGNLWVQLLGGFSPWLREEERIVFVPDGPLHSVPFAALWNDERQHYLLQDHQVTTAPSALAYVASIERSRVLGLKLRSVLSVGDPALDRRLWPSLDSLNGAQREAREVAALYAHRKILVGDAATISGVDKFSGDSDVIHFASHALLNSDQPLLSMLLLSPDMKSGGQGVLYARDFYNYNLPKTRIIILAACSSLGESSTGREGLSSFARPLLAIGVPAVVGSLWNIEDEGSSKFLVRFHRNLLKQEDPVEALRKTQMESLALKGAMAAKPEVWAAFQVSGS
jgi:CHAT domain-containing protein